MEVAKSTRSVSITARLIQNPGLPSVRRPRAPKGPREYADAAWRQESQTLSFQGWQNDQYLFGSEYETASENVIAVSQVEAKIRYCTLHVLLLLLS